MTPKIVAELSGNHNGSLENCLRLIDEAKKLQVDCIKFQCFHPRQLAMKRAAGHLGEQYTTDALLKIYQKTYTPLEWWPYILDRIGFYPWSCSVFSLEDLALMEERGCPCYKIASFEAHDLELIRAVANTRKPLVISVNETHEAEDIDNANNAAEKAAGVTFLYATPYDSSDFLENYEGVVKLSSNAPTWLEIGLSDHSASGIWGLAQKCTEDWLIGMVERHLRLPDVETVDAPFSDTPEQFAQYMKVIRDASPIEVSRDTIAS